MRRLGMLAALLAGLALGAVASCRSAIDPDQPGLFSCSSESDCGKGWECRPQAGGGGLCYPAGQCIDETCNGLDDDCNGLVDDSYPDQGGACTTSRPGVCAPGQLLCVDAGMSCISLVEPSAEACNGLDEDCDGTPDDGFDLTSDPQHCGACGHACGAGSECKASFCHELLCGDGEDNDGDGLFDCEDGDCVGEACDVGDAGSNCGRTSVPPDGGADGGGSDGGVSDGGDSDGGGSDGGVADGGDSDGGVGDGGTPDAGEPTWPACVPRESACDNGVDDDGDGRADCADPDCEGRTCAGGVCFQGACIAPG